MVATLLSLLLNVIIPAVAGFLITLKLVLSVGLGWLPSLDAAGLAMIPVSGLVTALMCLAVVRARRLVLRRTI